MGGQTCLTCRHEAREAIDGALVVGTPLRNIAEQHGLSSTALHRHKKDHLSATLVKAAEASDLARGGELLDQVLGLSRPWRKRRAKVTSERFREP